MATIPCRDMPKILIRLNDSRNRNLAQGFISYNPELVKMGNCAKKAMRLFKVEENIYICFLNRNRHKQ